MSDPITVFLADDQELVRSGFRMLIDAEDDMEVVGEGVDGADTVRQIATLRPDVVLMDIRMPGMDGVEATKQVVALDNGTKVLVLTTFDLDEYVFAALKAGASGFLLKDTRPADLLSAIRAVAAGDSVVAPSATRRLLDHVAPTLPDHVGEPDERLDVLTDREREVLVEVAKGATNAEIATNLFMAEGTVKTHIGRLLAKLHCRDRVGLVLFAYETGLAPA
ncbi:DNA-binding response regulator [Propionibacterium freudenreichii]|uniref:Two component transcriptional regulator, LuxR family n=3 Tax=Propionibacterium freudenreichii TaxID=1744 RepID=D7GGN9_PROFC|nr:response regulator transcription factor [Propionibacterium freudenreichii]MDN5985745.1 response regulator transcription factor [Propionibacterium sp.]AJQ91782.1 Two-component system response regulator [Propionibacterium freudenreichii subsp. freudenreichii]ARO12813.1 DNA-binding response regulator [Propionibacterium freudenreichii]AWY94925.1 Response regulator receiver domain protein [Propionibacterium freudenreichii]MCQ1998289.1 response regulator transcription factor [Propionibacterium fr